MFGLKMFTVIYSFCWCNIITNYVDYDVIRGQKVTYKLPKWKSTNQAKKTSSSPQIMNFLYS